MSDKASGPTSEPKDFSYTRTGEYIAARKKFQMAMANGNDAEAEKWKAEMERIANKNKQSGAQPMSGGSTIAGGK